jgi:hypothetical protein
VCVCVYSIAAARGQSRVVSVYPLCVCVCMFVSMCVYVRALMHVSMCGDGYHSRIE